MRNISMRISILALMLLFSPPSRALTSQEAVQVKQLERAEVPVYLVEYTVRELEDGKKLNSRKYMLMLSRDRDHPEARGMIRTGSNIPMSLPEDGENKGKVQYGDVGIKFDCQVRERDKGVELFTNFESSYVPKGPDGASSIPGLPIIRSARFFGNSWVALDKPTVIGTVDDVMTNRRYEVEVTVTKVK